VGHYRRALGALALFSVFLLSLSSFGVALAQASTFIAGVVTSSGKPAANVPVTLKGNNLTQHATTDSQGKFAFNALTIGNYLVSVPGASGPVTLEINLSSTGTTISLDTAAIKQIGAVRVSSAPVNRAAGTDVVINADQLSRAANANSLPDILLQIPDAARGSNGQVHLNGDHNGINYVIDGVEIPEGLNRVLGDEIDPSNIGFAEVIEGAYSAQYGDKFAGVFNITTKGQTGPAGFTFDGTLGSLNDHETVAGYHTPVGTTGSLYVGARLYSDSRVLDPPSESAIHDNGSTASQFLRYTNTFNEKDTLTFDLTHSLQTFQVPPDISQGTPASTDDNENQEDLYSSLIYRHAFSNGGVLTFGPSFKRSNIVDTNDPQSDLIGQIQGPDAAPCQTFANCGFLSVFANRTDINDRFNTDYVIRTGSHEIRAGALYGEESLQKDYRITIAATNAAGTALEPFTVTDTAPNEAHTQEFYVQDGWQMDSRWRADYGLRADAFQVFSTEFDNGFSQVSPRFKLTRIITPRSSIYAYYGRLFEPFSLESISPTAAAALYGNTFNATAGNDLRPQRDSLYETGAHMPFGAGQLGLRISHKVSTDWIDDTQVGATNLHQDINFPRGLVDSQSLYYNQQLARHGTFYLTASHVVAQNSLNCETQLLQDCSQFGPPGGDLVQADHDQHYDATSGFVLNNEHNGWLSFSGEYGSGLSRGDTALCPPFPFGDAVNCKVPPHLTFDLSKGVPFGGPHSNLVFSIQNLFNDRYAVVLDSTLQGTHFAQPRTFTLRYHLGT
jgi:outer membrane receptor for ferrienterochelin and colicin